MAMSKTTKSWLVRIAGSAVALTLLFWLLPDDAIFDALKALPAGVFVQVLILFLLAHVGAALKWWCLLGRIIPATVAIRAHFSGLAANLCLPGAIGGDAVRAAIAQSSARDGARVVAVAAADRLIDMVSLLTISVVGLMMAAEGGGDAGLLLVAALFVGAVFVGLLLLPWLVDHLWRLAPRLPGQRFARKTVASLGDLLRQPGLLALVFSASLAVQTGLVLLAFWLATAAGADVGAGPWLFAWPLAKIIAVLPVALNGLGLREGVLAAILAPFGADPAGIVAAGLVWQAIMFAAGGLGALLLFLARTQKKSTAPGA
ncbi:lysylphosphatidylglycerol synthase transmembrane domain-containing protein [Fluviibacterium sp. DFM31]|uniref:Lysylphosphatidylglycerol synthase transmembrane domain-containing protein n=1 Tax=Meridianimarinicoccus marinus TaxID=3231483 RepID=A0ABV3L914_9RHOB